MDSLNTFLVIALQAQACIVDFLSYLLLPLHRQLRLLPAMSEVNQQSSGQSSQQPVGEPKKKSSSKAKQRVPTPERFDFSRMEGPDPRDSRTQGYPCFGKHVEMPEGRGSLSGRNGHAMWKVLPNMQIEDSIRTKFWCEGLLSTGGATGPGRGDCGFSGQGQAGEGREPQLQDGKCLGSRGIAQEQATGCDRSCYGFLLPCGLYSPIQTIFNEDTPEQLVRSEARKAKSRHLIRNGLEVAEDQLLYGGELAWEWPANNGGWRLQGMRAVLKKLEESGNLHVARVDGCAYGLRSSLGNCLKKPWRVCTTSHSLAMALERRCPGHHQHDECLGGSEARRSGFYPQAMRDVIQKAVKEMINKTDNGVFPQAYPVFEAEEKQKTKVLPDPLTEEERKEAKKMLSKLHRKTGHPSNHALSSTLKHRGAHYEVVEMAKHHQCPECQELRMAPLHPSVALQTTDTMWETVVMDNAEFPVDEKIIHCMIMVDEASRFAVPHFLFEHGKQDHRNATGPEVIQGLQESWLRHYGMPANVRMDPEGAFRSNELIAWGEERGVHFLPCAAESHGQIGIAERAIQTIKSSARQILQGADVSGWVAIQEACRAHNELAKVEGFSPFQWAFGRQPTLAGHMHEKGYDTPFLTSSAIPGSSMASNPRCRVEAQQAFLKHQAYDQISRAANSKTRRSTIFVPGDLIFFKRVKPPAQPVAAVRMPHRLWRWYGPGRGFGDGDKIRCFRS